MVQLEAESEKQTCSAVQTVPSITDLVHASLSPFTLHFDT